MTDQNNRFFDDNTFYEKPYPPRKKRRSKKTSIRKRLLSAALCGIVFGGSTVFASYFTNRVFYGNQDNTAYTMTNLTASSDNSDLSATNMAYTTSSGCQCLDAAAIAQYALPSIVSITNISVQEVQDYFDIFWRGGRGSIRLEETTSVGSGIIIKQTDTELYIVTNNHVVENATNLSVTFVDDQTYEATLIGTDETNDLAVISVSIGNISSDTLSQISVAQLGDSDSLQVGEQVVAIGNALGYGQSVTAGIVSALNRVVGTSTYIQTDATINPGNSGGALLNASGQVIGINTAKLSSTEVEGMGYAIPISLVKDTIEGIINQSI